MWTRKELKTKAKLRFKANYWKAVLIGLAVLFITGGSGTAGGFAQGMVSGSDTEEDYQQELGDDSQFTEEGSSQSEEDGLIKEEGSDQSEEDALILRVDPENGVELNEEDLIDAVALTMLIGIVVFVAIIICLIAIPLEILVFNPLYVGCKRFYLKNLKEDAQVREICYAFDNGYKNTVKTMFFRELYTLLWCLLLFIPGIIKSYEYSMIPYILAEHPDMPRKEVFALSKKMMDGNKWRAFLLDLSFFGWLILDALTLGILGIFYLNPYMEQTGAALYEKLKEQ